VTDGGPQQDAPAAEEFLGASRVDAEWVNLRFRMSNNMVLTVPVTSEEFAAFQAQQR
jgi:hypothetical protein